MDSEDLQTNKQNQQSPAQKDDHYYVRVVQILMENSRPAFAKVQNINRFIAENKQTYETKRKQFPPLALFLVPFFIFLAMWLAVKINVVLEDIYGFGASSLYIYVILAIPLMAAIPIFIVYYFAKKRQEKKVDAEFIPKLEQAEKDLEEAYNEIYLERVKYTELEEFPIDTIIRR